MILNKEDKEYLKGLSEKWDLNFREPITEGTYRWYLFIYTNLYECSSEYNLTKKDRDILKNIFDKLKPEHKLTWIRRKMYEASPDITATYHRVQVSTRIREHKVALYLMYCIENKEYILDDYMIETFKSLDKYRR